MIFGGIVCLAGFVGVSLGSTSAQYFRSRDGRADPFVCATGIFAAIPFTFFGLVFAKSITTLAWYLLFLAVTALSTNWAVVSDMVLSTTLPNKRAFATAIQILVSHLFGDAASPYIVGQIRDYLNLSLHDEYQAFLYALLSTLIVLAFGAISFLYCSKFFVQDVSSCKLQLGKATDLEEPTRNESSNLTDFANLS